MRLVFVALVSSVAALSVPRRDFLSSVATASATAAAAPGAARAAALDAPATSAPTLAPATSEPRITHRLFMEVRIARTDGTFAVRDDDDDPPYRGRLTFGLYGDAAPKSTRQFLQFVEGSDASSVFGVSDDGLPRGPRYSKSLFARRDGLVLEGGKIGGLTPVALGAARLLRYKDGSALDVSSPPVESSGVRHARRGLLTRRVLDGGPEFGITLTALDPPELEAERVVFGTLLDGGDEFLRRVERLPVYSYASAEEPGSIADEVFQAQKKFFVDASKSFRDDRAASIYPGKILRRVEVTRCELLPDSGGPES